MDQLLTVNEASAYLRVSRSTLDRYCKRKEIPHIKKSFGLRFRQADLDKWLEEDKRKVYISDRMYVVE